jgi:hypothetical protein
MFPRARKLGLMQEAGVKVLSAVPFANARRSEPPASSRFKRDHVISDISFSQAEGRRAQPSRPVFEPDSVRQADDAFAGAGCNLLREPLPISHERMVDPVQRPR